MVEMETVIELKNLGLKAGRHYLLKDINWQIHRGEHWVVFGMNGSGKTTLLSIIAGFNNDTHGELKIMGVAYTRQNILALRRRIGWVSSSFFDKCLSQETVLDIVLSGLSGTFGVSGAISDKDVLKAKGLLDELHLHDKSGTSFVLLSKGERQNVLIARALIAEPEILVLDEPCTGLDVFAREYLLSTLRTLARQTNVTIIYVTHYTEEILDVFEHCLLLRNGRVYAQGLTENLFCEETLANFLEYPVQLLTEHGRRYLTMTVSSGLPQILGYKRREVLDNG